MHSKGEDLFQSLMRWIELFLTVVREGFGQPISLEFLLPHTGKERLDILQEVDKVALYHYKLKVIYEDKIRRRFGKIQGQGQSDADAEDEATRTLVNGVAGEISFGELIQGDADDLAAEETDESGEESSEYESTSGDEDEDDSDSDDGSEGSVVGYKPPQVDPPRPSVSSTSSAHSPVPPQTPPPRKRTFSLKSSRSMNFSLSQSSLVSLTRRSHDVPPVPPLPAHSKSAQAALSKPLPPSPTSRSSIRPPVDRALPATPSRLSHAPHAPASPPPPPPPTKKKAKGKKKPAQMLKPPELQHIPQLLPVFTEMVGFILSVDA